MAKNNEVIPFRIRKHGDEDLKAIFEELPEGQDRSEIIRAALRAYYREDPAGQKPEPSTKPISWNL